MPVGLWILVAVTASYVACVIISVLFSAKQGKKGGEDDTRRSDEANR